MASASHSSSDAIVDRVCRSFDAFARNEAQGRRENRKYFFVDVLGSGATGIVFSAKRVADDQTFAVKVVDMEGMSEADKTRAQAEVHCLLNCDFFSILKCHEDFAKRDARNEEIEMIALVLDYANAGDLRQEIRNRAKTSRFFLEHEAGLLFIQVLLAIHHVHSRHMIHRDIKSANILLCSNGLVKLGDFGFSKMYAATVSDDVGRTFCGTPYYVAPEIWRRQQYSKKADMFSLGVLLYELLTLKRPFDGANMNEVMDKALAGQYDPLPSSVSSEMADVVHMLLASDPHKRPSSSKLLSMPICRLFVSVVLDIVGSQETFDGPVRELVKQHIQQTRQAFNRQRKGQVRALEDSEAGGSTASTTVLEGGAPLSRNIGSLTLHEGIVRKQSSDGAWKRRYLCIRAELGDVADKASTEELAARRFTRIDLVQAVSKDTMQVQSVATPFSELEDVYPMPSKYTGGNVEHVFAIAFKTGKRMLIHAHDDLERDEWMAKIQEALGIGDEE